MEDQVTPALAQSSAVRAFEDLRGEVSLLRRAVEGLAAERRDQPDYGPTLEALVASNEGIREWARKVSERPALQLTPQRIGEQIEAVTSRLRTQDREVLDAAQGQLARAVHDIKTIFQQVRTTCEQLRRQKIVGGVCFLGGLMLWPILEQIEVMWR